MTTSIQSFDRSDWTLRESNTGYGPHGIHTWLAAMIPALAKKLIQETNPTNLLDPFCGGGTACVEAVLNDIPTSGLDINPLSGIITRAKTTPVNSAKVLDTLDSILQAVKTRKKSELLFPDHSQYKINYWFLKEHLPLLDGIARAVLDIKKDSIKTFFQCIFSATIRDVSLTHRNEIRLRRLEPHELEKFNRDVLITFSNRVHNALERLSTLPKNPSAKITTGDIKKMSYSDDEFSTIICSPPYGDERNGVPYFQFVKNMLYWLGVSKEELVNAKSNALGTYNRNNIKEKTCPDSKTLKQTIKKFNNSQNVSEAIAFYSDYEKALLEMKRVTSDKIVIVIGNRVLNKTVVNNATITTEIFENMGVKLVEHHKRDLPSKRIPRFGGLSKIIEGGQIDKEDILIYSKC